MKIAFVFIAEAYQCYHGAGIAFELASMPDVEVSLYYNDPETLSHLERIRLAWGAPPLRCIRMERPLLARVIQRLRVFGLAKPQVLRASEPALAAHDAIFALEDSAGSLFAGRGPRPVRIHMSHGSGDRAVGFSSRIAAFDLVLLTGRKTADRLLALGHIRAGHYALPGYAKLETVQRLAGNRPRLFANDRPIVLYNPHKARGLQSWRRFIEPMLRGFAAQTRFDLVVAPHVKMFRRRSQRVRDTWRRRGSDTILVDPGSPACLDNTYTTLADVYVGDVSSQVYEFLGTPRPCVFLNAHGIDWRDDPDFAFWHLGDVVDDPADLMEAIAAAPARHALYRDRQIRMAADSLGDCTPGAARRAADAILAFLKDGRVAP